MYAYLQVHNNVTSYISVNDWWTTDLLYKRMFLDSVNNRKIF